MFDPRVLKRILLGAVVLATMATMAPPSWASSPKGTLPMKTYQNPILPGFHPDPSICRAGEDFYLVNSTFEYFPGLPVYHSRDLVHWRQIGNALDRPSQLPLKGATDFGGLYAPTIRYHQGVFYLTCTNVTGGGNFMVTATDPAGPWSEPVWMDIPDIDGSIFFDDDGKVYFTNQGGGEWGGIKQAEIDPKTFRSLTKRREIWNDKSQPWNEGPHLYKIRGKYYLMLAEGGTGTSHAEYIGRADNPWGPFEPCPHNPILTHRDRPKDPIQCTGHADLVEAPDGSWWAVFLATRPLEGKAILGRETFLAPVTWTDGWPMIGLEGKVALEMEAPKLPAHPFPVRADRDDFGQARLGPEWIHVRNPDPADLSLSRRKGHLSLRAAAANQDDRERNPAFAGRRQPDHRMTARTSMVFSPVREGEEAGLSVRANDDHHYDVGLGRFGETPVLFVRNRVKAYSTLVTTRPAPRGKVFLEIQCNASQYQFFASKDGKNWEFLAASPVEDLTRERAGGFTGAVVGLYATANGNPSDRWAEFDWFEMKAGSRALDRPLTSRPTPTPVPAQEEWRLQAGGPGLTDSEGHLWGPDRLFDSGETVRTDRPIRAKKDAALFQTERWGSDFTYSIPVPPGEYQVRLLFAETYVRKPGERVFDVEINGRTVLSSFDILKEAGGFDRGIEKRFEKLSPDASGYLKIRFIAKVQNAKVCALEILKSR